MSVTRSRQPQLAAVERLRARQDLASIAQLRTQIAEAEVELPRLSTQVPWAEMVPFLIQLPGSRSLPR